MKAVLLLLIGWLPVLYGCSKNPVSVSCIDPAFFTGQLSRNFTMGFTTWRFAPDIAAAQATYTFIGEQTDIYSEQIDHIIPWQALLRNEPLPSSFTNDISYRLSQRPAGKQLLLSVSLLNINRTDLLEDVDGSVPVYSSMSDPVIINGYYKLLLYLIDQFHPQYLVIGMEVNELLIRVPAKWYGYKNLAATIRSRLKTDYPDLKVSESVTLHNWFQPNVNNIETYQSEMKAYVNSLDFAAVSFYPFLKNQHSKADFQEAFDFLHQQVTVPIAFTETAHIAEPLSVPAFQISMDGSECGQNDFLETLCMNAQEKKYLFLIWWTHRDYDRLWAIFPDHTKDLGLLWRDTGILDEDGRERPAFHTWRKVFGVK